MTEREAFKLALEALEDPLAPTKRLKAITAIKEALAQPEQEQFALKHRIAELEGAVIGLQTQRTWVGLTDEEVIKTFNAICNGKPFDVERILELHRAIEAKLKEKNT